jgi:hypothetical protein
MAYDAHLVDLMRSALHGRHRFTEKRMFGTWCWLHEGKLVCGAGTGRYLFRVGKALEPEALARPGATRMESAGRAMSGFIWVDADAALDEGLQDWVALALRCVDSLPRK